MTRFGELLWQPSAERVEAANLTRFTRWLGERERTEFPDYHTLRRWSVEEPERFWRAVWDYFEISSPVAPSTVCDSEAMPGARWFPDTRVNFAAHLLRQGEDDDIALVCLSESGPLREVSWAELRREVATLAAALRDMGIRPGDRVAGYLPTGAEAVIAMLATMAVGGVWSCCSPDFGVRSVFDRFGQIEPSVLIAVDGYRYGGRDFDRRDAIRELAGRLPTLKRVVHVPGIAVDVDFDIDCPQVAWHSLMENDASEDPDYPDLAFDHPLWVVFSSGTTGPPKAIVHGHGGVLIELLKGITLHMDVKRTSRMFFYTTTGWIVFPNLVAALLGGGSILLYDGNPAHPDPLVLFRMAEEHGVTHFGTSPSFVSLMSQHGISPRKHHEFPKLECVVCTGSPLTPESFSWIYDNVKRDLWVTSVSGGTDVVSALVGSVPTLPVHNGEIQARCLGIAVEAWDENGNSVVDEDGELVITRPFPSMPTGFWNDPTGERYRESYFDVYPGVWCHGDQLRITPRGTCIISGRSDATLNRHGIRIGTSEIYRCVEAVDEVVDSLVVNLELSGGRFFMPLFVELHPVRQLDDTLKRKIASRLREEYSPRHVPDEIYEIESVPYTMTGKKMEVPVKKILLGKDPERVARRDIMRNPESLDAFIRFAGEQEDYSL